MNDILTGKSKDSINNLHNDYNNNYNKYDIDDMLDSNMNENNNENYYSKDKNSFMKNSKQTKSNVLKESGQNIIYGMNDLNNKYKEKEKEKNNNSNLYNDNSEDELNNINYDELDNELNEDNNNKNNNKESNPKLAKLKKTTTPYERLEILDQLENEHRKETEELLENMKNENISQNLEDI